jgi:hypothetical protein
MVADVLTECTTALAARSAASHWAERRSIVHRASEIIANILTECERSLIKKAVSARAELKTQCRKQAARAIQDVFATSVRNIIEENETLEDVETAESLQDASTGFDHDREPTLVRPTRHGDDNDSHDEEYSVSTDSTDTTNTSYGPDNDAGHAEQISSSSSSSSSGLSAFAESARYLPSVPALSSVDKDGSELLTEPEEDVLDTMSVLSDIDKRASSRGSEASAEAHSRHSDPDNGQVAIEAEDKGKEESLVVEELDAVSTVVAPVDDLFSRQLQDLQNQHHDHEYHDNDVDDEAGYNSGDSTNSTLSSFASDQGDVILSSPHLADLRKQMSHRAASTRFIKK